MTGKPSGPRVEPVDNALFHRADIVARHRAADHLLGELEALAARQRLDVEHDIAELPVAAGLLLVAAALDDRLADGLLVADRGWMRGDLDAEAVAQPLARHAQMHLALAPQHGVVGLGVHHDAERRILLVQPGKGLAELDVVLAVGGGDRDREHRRRRLRGEQRSRRGLAARDRVAGLDRVDLGERNRVAGFGRGTLGIVGAVDGEDAGDAAAPPEADCSVAPSSRWPASNRVSDSFPPCCECSVLKT